MKLEQHFLRLERCPHCGIDKPTLAQLYAKDSMASDGSDKRLWVIYMCHRCGGMVLASARNLNEGLLCIYPDAEVVDDSIPKKAAEFLKQAISSLSAPAGAIMLCASSLDAMLKEKGYKEGKLYTRIEAAATAHLLTEEMKQWAHEIRLEANDQRHADEEAELPTREDAKKTLEFVKAVAQFLFVLPARVSRGLKDAKGETKPNSQQ